MKRKLIVTLIFLGILIAIFSTSVFANFQSIPTGSAYSDNKPSQWIQEIRKMEASNQGMGLNETINTTTLLSTSGSNNIDVHMIKNTEYGAIVLLGASEYGKQGSTITARRMDTGASAMQTASGTNVKATTTGNVYGIYELGYCNMNTNAHDPEITASGDSSYISTIIAKRYINRYTTNVNSARVGDATVETKEWHGSEVSWLNSNSSGLSRGEYGAFAYKSANNTRTSYSRATIVCGTGL